MASTHKSPNPTPAKGSDPTPGEAMTMEDENCFFNIEYFLLT